MVLTAASPVHLPLSYPTIPISGKPTRKPGEFSETTSQQVHLSLRVIEVVGAGILCEKLTLTMGTPRRDLLRSRVLQVQWLRVQHSGISHHLLVNEWQLLVTTYRICWQRIWL